MEAIPKKTNTNFFAQVLQEIFFCLCKQARDAPYVSPGQPGTKSEPRISAMLFIIRYLDFPPLLDYVLKRCMDVNNCYVEVGGTENAWHNPVMAVLERTDLGRTNMELGVMLLLRVSATGLSNALRYEHVRLLCVLITTSKCTLLRIHKLPRRVRNIWIITSIRNRSLRIRDFVVHQRNRQFIYSHKFSTSICVVSEI